MKVAHIVPFENRNVGEQINDMHLLLYHWAKQNSDYLEFYKHSKVYKILDNSFYELRKQIDYHDLIEVAKDMQIQEIVAPDIMYDFQKTKEMCEDFFKYVPGGMKVQAVVCGSSYKEIVKCFNWMNENDNIHVIAFSKHGFSKMCDRKEYERQYGKMSDSEWHYHSRQIAFKFLKDNAKKPIHFLGCNLPLDYKTEGIRSIDSKYVAKAANNYDKIDLDTKGVLDVNIMLQTKKLME